MQKEKNVFYIVMLVSVFVLSGCVVRTYQMTRDRVDQDLTKGNRGYLMGEAPGGAERKLTRTTQVVEVELGSPFKLEKRPKMYESAAPAGNQEPAEAVSETAQPEETPAESSSATLEKYTVQKGDTLQKISLRFFGTTQKWNKIFKVNKETLKSPNKIYPGQVIMIPVDQTYAPSGKIK